MMNGLPILKSASGHRGAQAVDTTVRGLIEQAQRQAPLTLPALVEKWAALLPLPAGGETLVRWRLLAAAGAIDLSLAKVYEGHADALAIMAELKAPPAAHGSVWSTWCAEPPQARLSFERQGDSREVRLQGTKSWCSAAAVVSHALVSAWDVAGRQWLAAVNMKGPGVCVTGQGWHAVGMAQTRSVDVVFDEAPAILIGQAGDYVARPGFWQGGAGVAACWWGGAYAIARAAHDKLRSSTDPHALAHLGAIDVAIGASSAALREAAAWIDAHPQDSAAALALRVRGSVEAAAHSVMRHAARALGAAPLCRNEKFARDMADLPVYLRQSHAERDLAGLGALLQKNEPEWAL